MNINHKKKVEMMDIQNKLACASQIFIWELSAKSTFHGDFQYIFFFTGLQIAYLNLNKMQVEIHWILEQLLPVFKKCFQNKTNLKPKKGT